MNNRSIGRITAILLFLYFAKPLVKWSGRTLLDAHWKMSARDVAAALDRSDGSRWNLPLGARHTQCDPGYAGWDYICSFDHRPRGSASPPVRMHSGVMVGSRYIEETSSPQPASTTITDRPGARPFALPFTF